MSQFPSDNKQAPDHLPITSTADLHSYDGLQPTTAPSTFFTVNSHGNYMVNKAGIPAFMIPAPRIRTPGSMQETLDSLRDDWISVDIVFRSLQSAFIVKPSTCADLTEDEYLDDVDRELSIAYDDLMAQVRRLYRQLNRLSREMSQYKAASSRDTLCNNGGLQQ
ncbi:hypothetical protein O0I10_008876 [Lichtheimia ornata]|uniref:Uncharacterized protein n=1 Tax=Lichtheimia ornata TaxID=688661 RepID=A0AAD7XSK2_9FUNG|nr:uncharacterized protein O0I10_008876 [Lichtheimia ornata]KAJ8655384.1 hypothetical protein O0I10_008876 [Lichtheimia ornata]